MASDDDDFFRVEASNNPHSDSPAIDERFPSYEGAMEYAQGIYEAGRFRCIWVSEWGEYLTRADTLREEWICFWWTPATDWGEWSSRGRGYPDGTSREVRYSTLVDRKRGEKRR